VISCLKIFGERNSGTTFVQRLLAQNLPVRILPGGVPRVIYRGLPFEFVRDMWFRWTDRRNLGWKHAFPDVENIRKFSLRKPLAVVCVCKNPYAYLLSLFRRPYHLGFSEGNFFSFLNTPCSIVRRERAPGVFQNPVELWNSKNRAFLDLSLSNLPAMLLRYEDVLANPEAAVEKISRGFQLKRQGQFRGVYLSAKGDKGRKFDDFQLYYLKEKWRDELMQREVEFINRFLDADLCRDLGYDVLNPGDFGKRYFADGG